MNLLGTGHDLTALLALIRDELGIALTAQDADTDVDDLASWDSVQTLRLVMLLERTTGQRLPMAAVLQARTVRQIHALVLPDPEPRGPFAKGGGR